MLKSVKHSYRAILVELDEPQLPSGFYVYITMEVSTMLSMGKSTN